MPSIVSTGIGSGLDVSGIVQQLVAAEGAPVESRLGQREFKAQAKLSAFGNLKSALADLRDKLDAMKSVDSFQTRKAASSDEALFTASADTAALPANYDVEILQLASAQKLTSGAFTSSSATVGTGTLVVGVGAASMALQIGTENNTLAGIRDAINDSTDNPGVAATIVNADAGSYLILTSDKTGAGNTITVTQSAGDGGLAAIEYDPLGGNTSLTESTAPQDAQIRVDGFDIVSSSNTFASAIDGVTIDVLALTENGPERLTVSNDKEAATTLVTDFVNSYNELVATFDSLTSYDADAELAAPLIGDATLRSIRDQVRREMSTAVKDIDAPFAVLGDVGIEVQLDGTLSLDEGRLGEVLDSDFAKFGQLFATTDGFATRLHTLTDDFLATNGVLESRTAGLDEAIDAITEERDDLNERLASLETRLLRQFNALDSLLAQLQSTSNFLTQQLATLPTPGSSN